MKFLLFLFALIAVVAATVNYGQASVNLQPANMRNRVYDEFQVSSGSHEKHHRKHHRGKRSSDYYGGDFHNY